MTGDQQTVSTSLTVKVWMDPNESKWFSIHPFGGLNMIADGGRAVLSGPDGTVFDVQEYGMIGGSGRWSAPVTMGTTYGPVFLACTYAGPGNYVAPVYNTDCTIQYSWFADRSTMVTHFIGEWSTSYAYIGGDPMGGPVPDPLPEYSNLGPLIGGINADFSGEWPNIYDADFHITNINGASEVDFSGVDDYGKWENHWIFGPGVHVWGADGGLKILGGSYGFIGAVYLGYPGFNFKYSGKITKYGQDAPDFVRVNDSILCAGNPDDAPHYDYITFPEIEGKEFHLPSFPFPVPGTKSIVGGSLSFNINIPWASNEHDPPLITDMNSDEAKIPIRGVLPSVGTTGFTTYYPVSIKVKGEIDVLRPDGKKPSKFKSKDKKRIVVTEDGHRTCFDIKSNAPCTVEREFKAPWWRNQFKMFKKAKQLAEDGQGDKIASECPGFDITWYTRHKHFDNEDIWWWGMYGYLNIEMYAPVECDIMMRLDWTHLLVEDNHYDGLTRLTGMQIDQQGGYGMYRLHLKEGINNIDVDLLFPTDMGGPVYPGRIDKISFSGFPVLKDENGNLKPTIFILDTMKLKAKHAAYFKIGFGTQRHHNPTLEQDDENYRKPDYSVPVLALDGCFGFGNIPDDAYKADEIGPYGGSLRYVDPQASTNYLVSKHRQMSLREFWSHLDAIEGVEAKYDPQAFLTAFSDEYGNHWSPGSEMADWLHPVLPYVLLQPDEEFKPPCSPAAGAISLPNIATIEGHVEHAIYAGIEVLTHDAARKKRLKSGHEVRAIRLDTNEVVARAETDDCGYAVVSPLPANEEIDYTLEWDA